MQEECSLGVGPTQCTFFVCFRNLRVMDRLFQYTAQKSQSFPSWYHGFHSLFIPSSSFAFLPFITHGTWTQIGNQNYFYNENKNEISKTNQAMLDYGVWKKVTGGDKDSSFT